MQVTRIPSNLHYKIFYQYIFVCSLLLLQYHLTSYQTNMHFNQTCRMMVVIYIVFFKKFSLKKKTSERRNMDNNLMQRRKIAKIHFLNIFQHMSNKVQLKVFLLLNYSCMLSILLNKQLLLMKIKKQVYTIPNENDIKYSLTLYKSRKTVNIFINMTYN